MKKYFNIKLEFDKSIIHQTIETAIKNNKKGYVCVMEANNITVANNNPQFLKIVNSSLINICDGSNVAWLLGKLHNKSFKSYIGFNIFMHYIELKEFKHFFIGNTQNILDSMKIELSKIDPNIINMKFQELPFKKVEEFDYKEIAKIINQNEPDLIWVSLGAPKQEEFMSLLLPHLNKGILLGVGAAFNFSAGGIGSVKRAPLWMRKLRMEWLYRAIEEPQKNIPRYLNFIKILPKLVLSEIKNKNNHDK